MLLTVYYLGATSFQSWRLRAVHQKISHVIDSKSSVVFLKKSDGNQDGMVAALASSDICVNSAEATVQDCFWSNEMSQGISIGPKQILYINPFITFPSAPSLIPFSYSPKDIPESNKNDVIHALIEAELIPDFTSSSHPILEIEAFAKMVAWKIDTKLSILVKTCSKRLSQLVFASFIQNNYVINDHLHLTRIQTVDVEGTPQDYEQILSHSKKESLLRSNELLSPVDWDKHLDGIRNLGVLANQASEFEYKKNLTEGKTGIVQPDLISSKNIEESLARKPTTSQPQTPKKSFGRMNTIEKTDGKIRGLKQDLKDQHDASAVFMESFEVVEDPVKSPDSPKFPVTPSKTAKKYKTSTEVTSPKFPIGSPAKKSFFVSKVDDDIKKEVEAMKKNYMPPSPARLVMDSKDKKVSDSVSNTVANGKLMDQMGVRSEGLSDLSDKIQDAKDESAKIIESEKFVEVAGASSDKLSVPSDKFPLKGNKNSFSRGLDSVDTVAKKEVPEEPLKEKVSETKNGSSSAKSPRKKSESRQPTLKEIGKVSGVEESTKSLIASEIKTAEVAKPVVSMPKEEPQALKNEETKASVKPAPEAPTKPAASQARPVIQRSRKKLMEAKPPNVLVYSDSTTTRGNVIKTLGGILKDNMYTIYPLNAQQVREKIWLENTTLLVVCGSVNGSDVSQIFLEYFFKGGKILCLCSDLLRQVLPTYHTAEVREHELVQFSYGQWKNIKMMHHIFCYQPSPIRKHFSQDSDEPPKEKSATNPLIVLPRSIELKDDMGLSHNAHVQILGTEDTWKTPSLLMVYADNGGKIIFSQIHLEIDPSFYENDEQKYQILMKNDNLRHEIFGDVLSTHLGLATSDMRNRKTEEVQFTKGFFLGRHELKFEILEQLKPNMDEHSTLKIDNMSVKFCGKNVDPPSPMSYCLPVMIHQCPDDFSTLDYFDTLKTSQVGRAMIYSHILASSMNMVNKIKYCHGLAIVSRVLKQASGRAGNTWLSPEGCLTFCLQLHIPLKTPLGQRIPLVQHLVAAAVATGIKNTPGYEGLDINVKWPNDIYANGERKIGGLIVNSTMEADQAICNIGLGLNLSNSIPTTCINDMILEYNKNHSKNLKPLTLEKTLAIVFNEIENILNRIQADDIDYLYDLYYSCWMHTDSTVKVISSNGQEKSGKILGIDEYGFLKIHLDNNQTESVHPDGNTFDMLRGLIVPKSQ